MTVSTSANRADYTGNGATTAFPVPFYFLDSTHLVAITTDANGTAATLVLGSDYTVVGAGVSTGGTLTTTSPLAVGLKLSILLNMPFIQGTHYVPNDPFPAASHESALDFLTLLVKQTNEQANRSLQVPVGEAGGNVFLPPLTTRRGGMLAFDAATGAPVATTFTPSQVSAAITAAANGGAYLATDTVLFLGGFGGDDALALQSLAHFNQTRRIINVLGNTLNFYTTCVLTDSGATVIDLNGGTVTQHTANTDSFWFKPTTAGVTAAFLNYGGIVNGFINHNLVAATSTGGNGLRVTQCNGMRFQNLTFNDADVTQEGGQFNRYTDCSFFAANGSNRGVGSALVHFKDALYASTLYQKPFTSVVENWKASATKLRDAIFRIHSGDGIHIGEGYGGNGSNCIVLLLSDHTNSTIASCSVIGAYLDCVNPSTGTPNVIEIRDDADATSFVYGLLVANCWMGNGSGVGILCRKANVQALTISSNIIVNMTSWAADLQGGTSTDLVIVGNQVQNCFGWRLAGSGGTFIFSNNGFNNTTGSACLSVSAGTWTTAAITGNVNANSGVVDYALSGSAVFTNGITVVGNASAYPGTSPNQSWTITRISLTSYANNAAAVTAGLVTGQLYRVGNVVQVV